MATPLRERLFDNHSLLYGKNCGSNGSNRPHDDFDPAGGGITPPPVTISSLTDHYGAELFLKITLHRKGLKSSIFIKLNFFFRFPKGRN